MTVFVETKEEIRSDRLDVWCRGEPSALKVAKLYLEDLLPCPFCGCTTPQIINTHTKSYWIECSDCQGTAHGEVRRSHAAAIRSAAKAWNRRT